MAVETAPQVRSAPFRAEGKMADSESILSDDLLRQLISVGEVDVIVGLPTHNHAKTVGTVTQVIQAGILKYFPRERAVIINADGGSRDGTPEIVTGVSIDDVRRASNLYALRTMHSISAQYATAPSPAIALRTIFAAADLLRARACVIISPESTSIEPDWLPRMLRPVYQENYDFVTPVYRRRKFEGLLLRTLIYPMTRALYGWRVREPFASDFAFSGRFGADLLSRDAWDSEALRYGPEMYIAITAMANNYRLYQAFLGDKAQLDRSAADLIPAMRQTIAPLYGTLESNFEVWSKVTGSQPVITRGAEYEIIPDPVRVNRKRLREMFQTGVGELDPIFRSLLSPATVEQLQQTARLPEDVFEYSAELWVKTVYEFAAAFRKSVISRDHIIQAMAPLYRGRLFSVLAENRTATPEAVESNTENLCEEFERQKPYLLELWSGAK